MKKIFIKALSIFASLSLLAGIVPIPTIAEGQISVGTVDMTDEAITLEEYYGDTGSLSEIYQSPAILADQTYNEYNLGDYLDANNKAVYAEFVKLVNPSIDKFTVQLPETVSFQSQSQPPSNDEFFDAVFGACASAMDAASYDNPKVFWLDQNNTEVGTGNLSYTFNWRTKTYTYTFNKLTFTPSYSSGFSSLDEVMEFKEKLETAADNFTVTGETTAEKLKCIHDTIIKFTNYDLSGRFTGNCLSALVTPGAVCEGYAKGFKLMCDRIGIPCVCVFGNYDIENSTAHMWNYVQMEDGLWYAVDVTWDDLDGRNGLELRDTYFLKGADKFNVDHTPCSEYVVIKLTYPELASKDYDWTASTTTTSATMTTTASTTLTTTSAKVTTTAYTTVTTTASTTATTTLRTTATTSAATSSSTSTSTAASKTSATSSTTVTTMKTTTKSSPTTTSTTSTTSTTTAASTTAPEDFEYGDLNHDGKVSIADLVYCASDVLAIEKAVYSCDLNDDGRVDVYDVVIMRQLLYAKMLAAVKSRTN